MGASEDINAACAGACWPNAPPGLPCDAAMRCHAVPALLRPPRIACYAVLATLRLLGYVPQEKVISDVLLADQPIKRFVKPEEVGALVRHLCTEEAAAITGACLSVDGGWTAR